ncbi:PREDICTED: uncharacterized protein LOC105960701 [Erythranthe guttata]|uniref:uncharacterized protein LOC105960701 n=1 Tax=Erythranthe guttata TaxID=4155 RepID=UPI00064D9166|nr:PREDICTED: uncharacterized protein LOC105960701 [Erythranthe guttata]|eukprot:XP_012840358.1 PREDICTED: uncharacterized protein LOC105960701 [Erythranthe guttata]
MSSHMEGGSTTRPPLLTGTNYSYWKTKMKMLIKSMDEDAWRTVLTGWKRPVATYEKGNEIEKHEKDWSKAEQIAANMNSEALNAIFNGIDINQFKIISACECAKEAWEKLQTAYEGTASVTLSKLQMLSTRFEDLRMEENETVSEFNSILCEISNEAHGLGETYPEVKLVRKVLRSMPDRFAYKITAIDEASDVDSLRLEDLIGNLQTFENKLNISRMDKEMKIALQTVSDTTTSVPTVPMTALEVKLTKSMSLIAKNFGKFINRNGHPTNSERKPRTSTDEPEVKKGIRCRECHGYGHIQAECANTLKKQRKSLATTWSDDNSESGDESEASDDDTNNDLCGTCRITEDTLEDITCTEPPHLRYVTHENENYENLNIHFLSTGSDESEDEGEESIQQIQKQLDDLLKQCHEVSNENKLLKERIKEQEEETKGVITKLNDKIDELEMEIEFFEVDYDGERAKRIRKNLFPKMHADDHQDVSPPVSTMFEASVTKINCTAFLPSNRLDEIINAHPSNSKRIGGCSKHMTGERNFLSNLHNMSSGQVTFGDGNKAYVKGKWDLNVGGLPNLNNVLYVEGLKSNLLSVSQLCDLYDSVLFTKRCVKGVPQLKTDTPESCGDCPLGKQVRTSHKNTDHAGTSRTLELIHMDLMGPMQTESIGGKSTKDTTAEWCGRKKEQNSPRNDSRNAHLSKSGHKVLG